MPSKWAGRWAERLPGTRLDLVPVALAEQWAAILDGHVDAALVRITPGPGQPSDQVSVIPLYREEPVVVCGRDHYLAAADQLSLADLDGDIAWQPLDDPLEWPGGRPPGQRPDQQPPGAAEAVALVATGLGFVVAPLSLARLHHRKDIVSIPLVDGPEQQVGIAWSSDRSTNDDPLLEEMVGIVRGRTARSSRGIAGEPPSARSPRTAPKGDRRETGTPGRGKPAGSRKRAPRRR
ncbi:LysR family transcriptional regulator [Hoyosella sp. G463]|uniref:LysR family transcriptional regulator n=2 Tax=Lolliginicoccus lacisalsi TaxID=2742202 RepID=A0A927PMX5_9ACTN|nr:LysR substrate-binding domain-containing protein [Lolliginicoccus lacisalsi]MBD8506961.1 LysR family transcriptional regulator [Lolliginicoccus lacisalsi]